MRVTVVGAGVAGLACALELTEGGAEVEVLERGPSIGESSCSWRAGGMLAPWCERAGAEPLVSRLGEGSIDWWRERFAGTACRGSLVVAHGRDAAELTAFARRTQHWEQLDGERIAALEADLAGRFQQALFFPTEAHLDPRAALQSLARSLTDRGGRIHLGVDAGRAPRPTGDRAIVDCSGLAARSVLRDLRGVKGEMLLLRSRDLSLTRPVRLLHPRLPLYVVPRGDGLYMIGATVIESDEPDYVTARSVLELLNAACALHPAFGAAQIVEIATGVRPAFADNLPRIRRRGGALYVNGFYRHGFLLAPALARMAADAVLHERIYPEVMDEDHGER